MVGVSACLVEDGSVATISEDTRSDATKKV